MAENLQMIGRPLTQPPAVEAVQRSAVGAAATGPHISTAETL
jgi:hypothetical protein